ncbi:amidohydrolase/deacetylase family metallohydrolase [Pigmentiphaga soli]|uniref:Amidohydrolase/deacetylase family metallohydrolase n=1 Tax=Pigmentiphaga soli TaxID=1007095 RepID=A0ABP8GGS1_9BURK
MANFRIEGARVWGSKDTAPAPVWISGDAIVDALPAGAPYETLRFDDAWIAPGFIDGHVHCFKYVTGPFGLDADFCGVRQGVTTIVDQGGPSCITIDAFRHFIAEPAASRTYCFISAYLVGGLMGHRHVALYGPGSTDAGLVIEAIENNRDLVGGIKVHADHGGFSRWGPQLVAEARKISDATGLPLYIHLGTMWTNAEGKTYDPVKVLDETAELLRPGDILAHPFTRRPSGGILADGSVHPVFQTARERGLKIDVGRGYHIDYQVARRVLDAGVMPDSLGSDVHGFNAGPTSPPDKRFNLFYAMSEMAALGIPVDHIVDMVTRNAVCFVPPPQRVPAAGGAGFTLFRIASERRSYTDYNGNTIHGDTVFYPLAALLDGRVHHCSEADMPSRLLQAA